MGHVRRGEIYLYMFEKNANRKDGEHSSVQRGFRPVLIIQNNEGNESSTTTVVAAMTSKLDKPPLPTHVFVSTDCGLRKDSLVLMEQMNTVDQNKLTHRVGVLDEETQKKADKAYAVNGGIA